MRYLMWDSLINIENLIFHILFVVISSFRNINDLVCRNIVLKMDAGVSAGIFIVR